ncbi:MAG: beta-galactosidase [Bryobacterales bacterium]|nr:beta-galactosidase [Bryobacterales bacterium]
MSSLRSSLGLALLAVMPACAASLVLPAVVTRDGVLAVTYRTAFPATGAGTLRVEWTDSHGRLVEDRTIPVKLTDEAEFTFPIDLRRARAMQNRLKATFTFEGVTFKKQPEKRSEEAVAEFIASPSRERWDDYEIIMWQHYPAKSFPLLKTIGISGGQYVGRNKPPAEFLLENDLSWYAENIATDFYAEYHRYRPDRRGNEPFYDAKALYKKDPSNKEAFKRHPSLSDPMWWTKIRERLVEVTKAHHPYRPFFYDLGDESGIGDLSAYWDFDFSDHALGEMRVWLKDRYATLDTLNAQWGTQFTRWDLVVPETTDEAMRRTDGNYSSWADHKEFMDTAFARALRMGRDAVQSVNPRAYVGIAGAQMPGWGGYDYWKLTQALNFFEPYNIGNNIEMIRSFAPGTPVVTTSFARGPWEKHRVWYEMLHGGRGLILWDDKFEYVDREKGTLGPRGDEVKPYYNELRNGLGGLFAQSRRLADPVAIHYSQASLRAAWMVQQQPKGAKWADRNASTERLDSDFMRLRESYCRLIEDLGLQYNFVASEQVEQGELLQRGYRVLVLPNSLALSETEAAAIRAFAAQGGTVVTESTPGVFDEHVRKLGASRLAGVPMQMVSAEILRYHQQRLLGKEEAVREAVRALLTKAGVAPKYAVTDGAGKPVTGVETHVFSNGAVEIVGLLSNPQLRVNELGPPEFKSNQRFESARELKVRLPRAMHVYDLRGGRRQAGVRELGLTLDPYEPALYAVSDQPLPKLEVLGPAQARRGEMVTVGLRSGASAAGTHVYGVAVMGPDGGLRGHYGSNVVARGGTAAVSIPFALNDAVGEWTIQVRDSLTGVTETHRVRLE